MMGNNKFRINIITLIGKRFSLLTIQQAWRDENSFIKVKCLCDCGKEWTGKLNSIQTLQTQSCGCRRNAIRN